MLKEQPLVSICIPSYNYAHLISTTIESALQQEYRHFEILISDNASTDDTRIILERYRHDTRIRIFHQETNIGIARNINYLVEQASGEYLVILGADDALLPNFLQSCMARMLDTFDPVDLVYGGAIICNEHLQPISVQRITPQVDLPYSHRNEFAALLQVVYILFTATLFKKSLFDEVGYLNHEINVTIAFDWAFLLALAAADKRFASIPEPVIMVRYHKDQASSSSGYFFTGHAFQECLTILERMVVDEHAWRFRGYEKRIIERLDWYDEMFRDSASLETLERYEAMVARLKMYAEKKAPVWPENVPLVSVIVVSDGDPGLLERTLDSLEAQSYTNWEAVIVQYGGINLEPLVRRRRAPLKYRFSFGHSTQPVARMSGMHLARGLIFAHLHTNATFRPDHLERIITSLEVNASYIAVTSAIDSFDQVTQMNYGPFRYPKRVVTGIRDVASIQDRLHVAPIIDISCVAHRRELLDMIGTLRIDQPIISEWDFILRSALRYGLTLVNAETVELHYFAGNTLVERPLSFLQGIDEVYKHFPTTDAAIVQKRLDFREAVATCLAQQADKIASIDGVFELVTTMSGLIGLMVTR